MSKKTRKHGRAGRSSGSVKPVAKFKKGNRVVVKPGTTDPDFPDIPLGDGWALLRHA
jgi:hypothetical protein